MQNSIRNKSLISKKGYRKVPPDLVVIMVAFSSLAGECLTIHFPPAPFFFLFFFFFFLEVEIRLRRLIPLFRPKELSHCELWAQRFETTVKTDLDNV